MMIDEANFKCRTFPFEWTNPDSAEVCPGLNSSEIPHG